MFCLFMLYFNSVFCFLFFFKQKTAYEMRISDWSSDVCSSDRPRKDDICYATQNRQDAVRDLASRCDVLLVVGSRNSSNSNRLRELAESRATTRACGAGCCASSRPAMRATGARR